MYEHKYTVMQAGKEVAQKIRLQYEQGAEAYIKNLCGTNFVRYEGFNFITTQEQPQE